MYKSKPFSPTLGMWCMFEKYRILRDQANRGGVGSEAEPASAGVLGQVPDGRAEPVFQPRRQAAQRRFVLAEPRQPAHFETRVWKSDALARHH